MPDSLSLQVASTWVRDPVCSRANQLIKQFAEMQEVMKQMGTLARGGR